MLRSGSVLAAPLPVCDLAPPLLQCVMVLSHGVGSQLAAMLPRGAQLVPLLLLLWTVLLIMTCLDLAVWRWCVLLLEVNRLQFRDPTLLRDMEALHPHPDRLSPLC